MRLLALEDELYFILKSTFCLLQFSINNFINLDVSKRGLSFYDHLKTLDTFHSPLFV